jgi:hypothetical protein
MNWLPPTFVEVGEMEARVGERLLTVKVCDPEVPPPGAGFVTVTVIAPPEAMFAAGTVAMRLVAEP